MPELPEVETVRRQLATKLPGRRFLTVDEAEPFILRDVTEEDLRRLLVGKRVLSVDRIGKFLFMRLTADGFLTFHLGMTGHMLVHQATSAEGSSAEAAPERPARGQPAPEWPAPERPVGKPTKRPAANVSSPCAEVSRHPHTRFLFGLEGRDTGDGDGNGPGREGPVCLEFRDSRKFGRVHLTFGGLPERMGRLGPDAWLGDWEEGYLAGRLKGRKTPVKSFLLDQRSLAGIGNIYADEILWLARISPLRPSGTIGRQGVKRLAALIPQRLGEGVELLGCSISDFVDTQGRAGAFQQTLRAYGREGQKCGRCGRTMKRVVIAGRSSTYCPGCQR